jgi:ATP-binding cassette, subfamily B, bacterial
MGRAIPYVAQLELADCAAACVGMALAYHGRHVPLGDLRAASGTGREGADASGILAAAHRYGLEARAVKADLGDLDRLPPGSILHWDFDHFIVFEKVTRKGVVVVDPAVGRRIIPAAAFGASYTGVAILLEPGAGFARGGKAHASSYRYLRPIAGQRVLARRVLVTSTLVQLLALAVPLFTAAVVGRIVPGDDWHLLAVLAAAMVAVAGYYFISSLIRAQVLVYLRTHLDRELTTGFVRHLTNLPYAFFLSRSAGDLMARLQSNATVREILTAGSLSAILDGGMATMYLVLLLVISPLLGVLAFGLGAVQVAVIVLARRKNQRLAAEGLEAQARSESYAYQMLAGIEDLKAAGAEDRAVTHWSGLFGRELEVALGRGRLSALVESATAALQLISPLALLAVGAALVLQDRLSLGAMLGLAALGTGFLAPLALLVTTGLELQLLGSYMARINDVLDTPAEQHGRAVRPASRLSGHIKAEGLSFRYSPLAPLAVDGVSVEVRPGQLVAIVGRSGSGKSTLARLLLGLYEPEAGSVCYDGTDLRELEARSVRRQLGIVTQGCYVFGTSVRDNIALSHPGLALDEVVRAARLACIDQDIEALTTGYETVLGDGGASLSGGQRQRLALARALAQRPSILFLDEATSALDALTEAAVYRNLATLGSTCIVVAHRLSTVSRADTIVVMDGGRVVEQGAHHELLARDGLYRELFSGQVQPAGALTAGTPARGSCSSVPDAAGAGSAVRRECGDEHVGYGRAGSGVAGPGDLAPAPPPEDLLRGGGRRQHGQRRPLLGPVLQDEVVQGPGDALPPPRGADQQLDQREGAARMLGGDLLRQRGGQVAPPGGRRPERHPEGVADQVTAVAGLGQDEARLAAHDPETAGEPDGVTGADLGAQGQQFVRVLRGLHPV